MFAELRALVRGGQTSGGYRALRSNSEDEQIFAQGLPPYTELARRGLSWATMSTSAVAGLVVRPTVAAAFEIFNGYQDGGKSLVIDRLFAFQLVSTAVNNGAGIWAMVTTPKAAVTSGTFAVNGNTGKTYAGPVIAAASTVVVDVGWFPWGPQYIGTNAATPGGAWEAQVEGRLIVPPKCSLALHVVSSIVGDTFTQGASWYEIQLPNE